MIPGVRPDPAALKAAGGGKYLSARERAHSALSTGWRMAHSDRAELEVTSSTAESFRPPSGSSRPPKAKVLPDTPAAVLPDETRAHAKSRFSTESTSRFVSGSSAAHRGFVRARPGDGFDRLSANRTNYEVTMPGWTSEAWASATTRASEDGLVREKGRLGPKDPTFKPRRDHPADFDLVTGRKTEEGRTYFPTGERKTSDRPIITRTLSTYTDPTRGIDRPIERAPAHLGRRGKPAERPPLGTLAAVRPKAAKGDTDYYEALRR